MSVEAMTWAWNVRGVTSIEKLVLVVLSNWMDPEGKGSITVARLIEETGLSDRSVRRALTSLWRQGLLHRSRTLTSTGAFDSYDYEMPIGESVS